MAKYLVIVESPTKVKTIKKFLGKNYTVLASNGHVRDLPKSQLGVSIEDDFEPKYITIRGKGELLSKLRKEAKKADKIFLATDPDREGEAISWHLTKALKLDEKEKKYHRISFNEITKNVVKNSLKNPRDIDMDLVDAQQARRVLDRIVGYQISPVLWVKVKRGLSAGRVQSVALNLICEREKSIEDFIPREYYTLDALIYPGDDTEPLVAKFYGRDDKKLDIEDREQLEKIIKACSGRDFSVVSVKTSNREKKPPLPFTTSTMQQEASKALNFSIQKTMRIAQQLYEGIDIKGRGTVGLITYLRTDSTRISDEAASAAGEYIKDSFGEKYLGAGKGVSSKGNIQDAHEAIRPADVTLEPAEVKASMSRDQYRLYQLIWKRFLASRMTNARYENTTLRIECAGYVFSASASRQLFDGFMSVYTEAEEKTEEEDGTKKSAKKAKNKAASDEQRIAAIDKNTKLTFDSFEEKQHFTQPPAHFTEASLVHTLEELGIGRPSTYSPTITTLLKRHYVAKEGRSLFITELGEVVDSIMKESFPNIVDEHFTANMERELDGVEEGSVEWKSILRSFYPDFEVAVKKAEKELEKVKIEDEVSDEICENCGRNMVIKYGPHGKFLACPGFPECRNTKPYLEKIGVSCPKCGKDIVMRKTRKGRRFYGCEDYPECDFMSWAKPIAKKCPRCGSFMVQKGRKYACNDKECGYVENSKEK